MNPRSTYILYCKWDRLQNLVLFKVYKDKFCDWSAPSENNWFFLPECPKLDLMSGVQTTPSLILAIIVIRVLSPVLRFYYHGMNKVRHKLHNYSFHCWIWKKVFFSGRTTKVRLPPRPEWLKTTFIFFLSGSKGFTLPPS